MLLAVLGILFGLIVLYLAVVIFAKGFPAPRQPIPEAKPRSGALEERPHGREDIRFEVEGTPLSGWLYLPDDVSAQVPCVLMNHGFGGTKDMALEAYALRFREAGLAAMTYDYRCFGQSEGEPRQLFAIPEQLVDCRAAIGYVRNRREIDPDRIAIWGTSAGGGYGLVTAAEDRRIACVCTHVAALDPKEDARAALAREGIGFFLRLFVHAQRDKGRSRFGLSAHRVPIVGRPGSLAMITAPGAFDGYARLAAAGFVNEVCARALLITGGYNPMENLSAVQCPVLLQVGLRDNLVSPASARRAAERLGELAELIEYPCGHFDIYGGEHFDRAVADQIAFFRRNLLDENAGGAPAQPADRRR